MEATQLKTLKPSMLIGLVGEVLTLAAIGGLLIVSVYQTLSGLDSEAAGLWILGGFIAFSFGIVFSVTFIMNLKIYKSLMIEGINAHTARKAFAFQLVYGIVLTFVIPIIIIGIPYLISGLLGLIKIK